MTTPTLITTAAYTKPDDFEEYNYAIQQNELKLEFQWYDYGVRFYDPALGRFYTLDPKAEIYNYQSLYVYAVNNPVRYPDINGEGIPPKGANYERTRMICYGASEKELADFDSGVKVGNKIVAASGVTIVASAVIVLTSEVWVPILASGVVKLISISEVTSM